MSDQDELDVLVEHESGTQVKGVRVSEAWVRPPYEVHTEEGTVMARDEYRMALALGALAETYDSIDLSLEDAVPTPVALDGKPAIATYLHGAQERPRSEVAELMGVAEKTVVKYLNRFDPRRRA